MRGYQWLDKYDGEHDFFHFARALASHSARTQALNYWEEAQIDAGPTLECSECCEQWKFSHPNMFVAACMQQPSLSEISNRHTIGLKTGILDAGRLDGAYESLDRIVRF
jgi:hypothetical protein